MLEAFVSRSDVCEWMRSGPAGPHLDNLAEYLARSGYRQLNGRSLLHAAWHFTNWSQERGIPITALDEVSLEGFQHHLSSCRCVGPNGGRGKKARASSRLFLRLLRRWGVVSERGVPRLPALVEAFRDWMVQHRGVTEVTLRMYGERIVLLLNALGDDPSCFQAQNLRDFVLGYARNHSIKTTKYTISAIRMFLRFLAAEGKCAAGLEHPLCQYQ